MKEIIKKYLERQCLTDEYLAGLYKEERLEGCIEYITNQARKKCEKGQNSVAIEDTVVFKWARDYFTEGEFLRDEERKKKEQETTKKFEAEQKEREAKWEKEKKDREQKDFMKKQHNDGQISMFDLAGFSGA